MYFISEGLHKEINIILQPRASNLGLNSGMCLQTGFSATGQLPLTASLRCSGNEERILISGVTSFFSQVELML